MDKGKSFLNVSIEVKANIAKVSVCFLAVKNLYFIYIYMYVYIYMYIYICASHCASDLESDSHRVPLKISFNKLRLLVC